MPRRPTSAARGRAARGSGPLPAPRSQASGEASWLTVGQAAKYVGVSESTLRKWADEGRVPAFSTPGGHRRFRRDDLGEFIESTRVDSQPGPGPTVLIVDDDDERRLLVRFSLEREGCVVREAATPDAGFDDVDEAPPDLILLNAVMRDFDGWELLCRLREAHGLESIPVVMFAGQPGANTGASRATRFVRKPDPVRLVESVKQLLASAAPHS